MCQNSSRSRGGGGGGGNKAGGGREYSSIWIISPWVMERAGDESSSRRAPPLSTELHLALVQIFNDDIFVFVFSFSVSV